MTPSISLSELLTAIEAASVKTSSGATARELADATGFSRDRCRELIRAGIAKGLVRVGRKTEIDISGHVQQVPCYEWTGKSVIQ